MTVREGVLPKQPLFYVLASIRFQPWLRLRESIPEIQGNLRDKFPLFTPVNYSAAGLQLTQSPHNGGSMEPNAWLFQRGDRRIGCQLTADQVVVHALEYSRFTQFSDLIKFVLESLINAAGFIDIHNLGIRYLDKIEPLEGESLEDYLPRQLLPFDTGDERYPAVGGFCQNSYRTADGILQARFWTGKGMLDVPADLVPLYAMTAEPSAIASPLKALPENHGILDTDSIWVASSPTRMGLDQILERVNCLHKHANWFFRATCSDQAFKIWRGEG